MKKSINNLVPEDFRCSPIWQPVDDLEDPDMEVASIHEDGFHLEEMYLFGAKFTLADGTEYDGFVRFSWGKPILIALAIKNMEFARFSAQRLAETEESHREFAQNLGKQVDDVFPIDYKTQVKLYIKSVVY